MQLQLLNQSIHNAKIVADGLTNGFTKENSQRIASSGHQATMHLGEMEITQRRNSMMDGGWFMGSSLGH